MKQMEKKQQPRTTKTYFFLLHSELKPNKYKQRVQVTRTFTKILSTQNMTSCFQAHQTTLAFLEPRVNFPRWFEMWKACLGRLRCEISHRGRTRWIPVCVLSAGASSDRSLRLSALTWRLFSVRRSLSGEPTCCCCCCPHKAIEAKLADQHQHVFF